MNRPLETDERRRTVVPAALSLALLVTVIASLSNGAAEAGLHEAREVLLHRLGLRARVPAADGVIWGIRLPRTLLAALIGAWLAAAGVGLQGLHRNPLADPHLLAIGPGAAIGAALGSLAGGTRGAIAGGAAFGVLAALTSRRVARRQSADPGRFVLVGVALGAVFTAWAGFVVTGSDRMRVPPMEFWLLGNLGSATWTSVQAVALIGGLALWLVIGWSRNLDLLALGEANARHLGVDVDLVGSVLSIAIGVMTGATVGAGGVIGFVGVLVPTLVRSVAGRDHRSLLIASALAGSVLLVAVDTVARTVLNPIEVPVGLLTTALGGPVFLWLLARQRPTVWS